MVGSGIVKQNDQKRTVAKKKIRENVNLIY